MQLLHLDLIFFCAMDAECFGIEGHVTETAFDGLELEGH